MSRHYNKSFYERNLAIGRQSARPVVEVLASAINVKSLVDFGCGSGAWASTWKNRGAEVLGIDGAYVASGHHVLGESEFKAHDLSTPIDLGRTFDLVECLEVAEHLPEGAADTLMDNLVRHGQRVLFSAATPGQGGIDHVNEQPYEYWREKFKARGFEVYDFLRPQIQGDPEIRYWYKYNLLFFAHASCDLPEVVRKSKVPSETPLRDFAPLGFRVRKALVGALPPSLVTRILKLREKQRISFSNEKTSR